MANPKDILKKLPRRAARDEQADQPAFGAWPAPPDELPASTDVATVFVLAMLDAALPRRTVARIRASGSLALVVEVPGADWVEPVADALKSARHWSEIMRRTGASKLNDKPSNGGDRVSAALSDGGSVLGVSPSPERYLPYALVTAADLRVTLGRPTPRVLRATIGLVTGKRPGPLPPDVALGLGFDEIVSCIRAGTSSRECVRRLRAARHRSAARPRISPTYRPSRKPTDTGRPSRTRSP